MLEGGFGSPQGQHSLRCAGRSSTGGPTIEGYRSWLTLMPTKPPTIRPRPNAEQIRKMASSSDISVSYAQGQGEARFLIPGSHRACMEAAKAQRPAMISMWRVSVVVD